MKTVKDKIKEKAKATKGKVKGKLKAAKACAALFLCAALCGCATAQPASRATTAAYDRIQPRVEVDVGDWASSNTVAITVNVTLGDGALASADSAGSTETQTATPTLDIKPDIDVRYNDALAAASTTSKGVLESLTAAGANKVLAMMANKSTGTVEVEKKDGTSASVKCENGQCSFCEDGNCNP